MTHPLTLSLVAIAGLLFVACLAVGFTMLLGRLLGQ